MEYFITKQDSSFSHSYQHPHSKKLHCNGNNLWEIKRKWAVTNMQLKYHQLLQPCMTWFPLVLTMYMLFIYHYAPFYYIKIFLFFSVGQDANSGVRPSSVHVCMYVCMYLLWNAIWACKASLGMVFLKCFYNTFLYSAFLPQSKDMQVWWIGYSILSLIVRMCDELATCGCTLPCAPWQLRWAICGLEWTVLELFSSIKLYNVSCLIHVPLL